jgi:fructose-1,6-bisphosphatase I
MIIEKSGGRATSLGQKILDIQPESLHQRVPVALGSKEQVDEYNKVTLKL